MRNACGTRDTMQDKLTTVETHLGVPNELENILTCDNNLCPNHAKISCLLCTEYALAHNTMIVIVFRPKVKNRIRPFPTERNLTQGIPDNF